MNRATGLLTSTQVCDATGVTYRQLDAWARGGVVHPAAASTAAADLPDIQKREIRAALASGRSVRGIARQYGIHPTTVDRVVAPLPRSAGAPATPGSGRKRLWDADEAAVIERMVRLCLVGLVPARAADVARNPGADVEVASGVFVRVTADRP